MQRLDQAMHQLRLVLAALQRRGFQEREYVAREAVREADRLGDAIWAVLRPDARAELRVERPGRPETLDSVTCHVVDAEETRADEHACRAVEELDPVVGDRLWRSGAEALDVPGDEGDAELAVGVPGPLAGAERPVHLPAEEAQCVDLARGALVDAVRVDAFLFGWTCG